MLVYQRVPLLLGGFNHLEKYEFVNGKDYPIYYIMENKKCSKPPSTLSLTDAPHGSVSLQPDKSWHIVSSSAATWMERVLARHHELLESGHS